jgi:hypothetical protein
LLRAIPPDDRVDLAVANGSNRVIGFCPWMNSTYIEICEWSKSMVSLDIIAFPSLVGVTARQNRMHRRL